MLLVKRVVIGLVVLALTGLIMALVAINLSDQAYLKLLQISVKQFSDYQLHIPGNFQVTRSKTPAISINAVKLSDTRNGDEIEIAQFYLQFDLLMLFSDTLLIKKLDIDSVNIHLASQAPPDQPYDLSILKYLPAIVFQDAKILNIVLSDRSGIQHNLYQLLLTAEDKLTPLKVTALGDALGKPYAIHGEFGTINSMFDSSIAFPIKLKGSWQQVSLNIEGSIQHIAQLSGMDLLVDLVIPDLDEVYDNDVMDEVRVDIQTRLTGDYDLPSLTNIRFQLNKPGLIDMTATGRIDDVLTLNGTQIKISGQVVDQQLLADITPDSMPLFENLTFQTQLLEKNKEMEFQNLQARFKSKHGLLLEVDGSMQIDQRERWVKKMNLNAKLKSPDTGSINPMLGGFLPEMGASKGQATLRESGHGVSIENISLTVGHHQDTELNAKGKVSIDYSKPHKPEVIPDLTLSLASKDLADLLSLFEINHPKIGPVSGTAELDTKGNKLILNQINLQAGEQKLAVYTLQGEMDWDRSLDYQLSSELQFKAKSPSIKKIMNRYDIDVPDLGSISTQLQFQGIGTNFTGTKMSFHVGNEQTLNIDIHGIAEKFLFKEWEFSNLKLSGQASASGTGFITSLMDLDHLPDLGALTSKFKLAGSLKNLSVPEIRASISDDQGVSIDISGDIQQLPMQTGQSLSGVDLSILTNIISLTDTGEKWGYQWPDLGNTRLSANLEKSNGHFILNELVFSSGLPSNGLTLKGQVNHVFSDQDRQINVSIEGQKLSEMFGPDFNLNKIIMDGDISYQNQQGHFKGKLSIGESAIESDLTVSLQNETPKIVGSFNSEHIQLQDFGRTLAARQQSHTKNGNSLKLFNTGAIPYSRLMAIDLDLTGHTDKLSGIDHEINGFDIRLILDQGQLQISPAKFYLSEGKIDVDLQVDAKPPNAIKVKIMGKEVKLGPLLMEFGESSAIQGNLDLVVDVSSQGLSEAEIAANLYGHIGLALENGKIQKRQLELIFLNLVGWLFSYGISDNELAISCGIINFDIQQGLANTGVFVIDGPKLLVRGDGDINLKQETIDYKVNLEKKKLISNNRVPIQITGSLANPTIKQSRLSAFSSLDRYLVSPVVEVPSELLGSLWDVVDTSNPNKSPCQKLVKE